MINFSCFIHIAIQLVGYGKMIEKWHFVSK